MAQVDQGGFIDRGHYPDANCAEEHPLPSESFRVLLSGPCQRQCFRDQSLELGVVANRIEVVVLSDEVEAEARLERGPQEPQSLGPVLRMILRGESENAADLIKVRSLGVTEESVLRV